MTLDEQYDAIRETLVRDRGTMHGMVYFPVGWTKIVTDLDAAIAEIYPEYRVFQVKEKFGGLRFYIDGVPGDQHEAIHALIRDAETRSFQTCETCGEPGEVRDDLRWIRTLCDEHAAARNPA